VGFEVYLQCFGETERTGLARDALCSLFPVEDRRSEPNHWRVKYDEMNHCMLTVRGVENNDASVAHLCIERPCGDLRLWNALFRILNMGSVVLFFPGGPLVVAQDQDTHEIPPQMTAALGEPVRVASGEAILEIVQKS
jgi:hypothetical protein